VPQDGRLRGNNASCQSVDEVVQPIEKIATCDSGAQTDLLSLPTDELYGNYIWLENISMILC
jgi:hypothetical protein